MASCRRAWPDRQAHRTWNSGLISLGTKPRSVPCKVRMATAPESYSFQGCRCSSTGCPATTWLTASCQQVIGVDKEQLHSSDVKCGYYVYFVKYQHVVSGETC